MYSLSTILFRSKGIQGNTTDALAKFWVDTGVKA